MSGKMFDSDVFRPESIDAETAETNKLVVELVANAPTNLEMTPQQARDLRESGNSWMGPIKRIEEAEDRIIYSLDLAIPVRVYLPDTINGVFLHLHGGGFVLMRPFYFDEALLDMATKCNLAVVSVDYRLAPENPYPAGPDDCEAAAVWLAENAQKEFGSKRLIIGGESAGATLSAVTLVRMRDKHHFTGFAGANLVFGSYDLSMTPSQRNWGEKNLIISTPILDWYYSHYVPMEKRRDPDVSPIYANLSDLPPALFTVGTLDPLLDDSLFMHARWMAAGNESEIAIYPGGVHGFNVFPTKLARQASDKIYDFLLNT